MATPLRSAFLAIGGVLGIVLIGLGGALLYWPTMLTGGAYELLVNSVQVTPDGHLEIEYDDRLAYGLRADWMTPSPLDGNVTMTQEVDTWSYREGNFLRWPRRRTGEHPRYELNPKGRQVEGGSDLESLRRRVLLTPGFYRLRAGERLLVFRCRTKSGEILDGYVKVGRE